MFMLIVSMNFSILVLNETVLDDCIGNRCSISQSGDLTKTDKAVDGILRIMHYHFLLISGMSQNFADCATMLSLDFRHVTELHESPKDGCQVPRSGQTMVASQQRIVPGRN